MQKGKKKSKELADKLLAGTGRDGNVGHTQKEKEELSPNLLTYRPKQQTIAMVKVFAQYLLSNVGLFIGTCFYATIGAEVFIQIELPAEELRYENKREAAIKVDKTLYYLADSFWNDVNGPHSNTTKLDFQDKAQSDLYELVAMVVKAVQNHKYDGTVDGWEYDWSLQNSLLFTITIMSTIGYGHIFPKTLSGKMFCMIYALIGIALLIVFLTKCGNYLASGLRVVYSRWCCRWFRLKRKRSECPRGKTLKQAGLRLEDEEVGEEYFMPTDEVAIPMVISITAIVGYIFMGAVLFHNWEGWDLGSAAYFSFITLTTIGFGDMVPNSSFDVTTFQGKIQIVITVLYCVIGMALISMCLSLIQESAAQKAALMAAHAGFNQAVQIELDVVTLQPRISDYFERLEAKDDTLNDELVKDNKGQSEQEKGAGSNEGEGETDEVDSEDEEEDSSEYDETSSEEEEEPQQPGQVPRSRLSRQESDYFDSAEE